MKKKNDNNRHSYIFTRETLGMTLLLFSALMLLILFTYNTVFSSLGAAICAFMYGTFGYGCYLVVAALAALGVWLVFEKALRVKLRTVAVIALTIAVFFLLFHAVTTRDFSLESYGAYLTQCYTAAEVGYSGYTFGGVLSGVIVYPIARGTTFVGAYVIFSILFALCAYLSFIVIRSDVAAAGGKAKSKKQADVAAVAAAEEQTAQPAINDNAYTVDENYQIVNNFHPVAPVPRPDYSQTPQQEYAAHPEYGYSAPAQAYGAQPFGTAASAPSEPSYVQPTQNVQSDEDKFSQRNLGRKILFDNDEFAAESYRRNMIFNDDSYFNHPVHNEGDYLSSFSSGKKPSQSAQPAVKPVQNVDSSPTYTQSYTQSYSEEAESSEKRPSTPSYIYGDKPVDSLEDYAPEEESYDNEAAYYDDSDYRDDFNGYDHTEYEEEHRAVDDDTDISDNAVDFSADEPAESNGVDADRTSCLRDEGGRSSLFGAQAEDNEDQEDIHFSRRESGETAGSENNDIVSRSDRLTSGGRLSGFSDDVHSLGDDGKEEEGEDYSRLLRRGEQPIADDQKSNPNDLRSIFSASNTNISDDIKPDASRLSSRREESRENLFDGDDDDYLTDDVPDLGTRGLRADDGANGVSSGRGESLPAQGRENLTPARPLQPLREEKAEEKPEPQPEKPKHVWKKYVRPTLDLLADYPENNNANLGEIEENKKLIIETLENFRIAAHISDVIVGPAITRYDVIIEDRTNIKSAMRYREAIAMALMKENVTAYLNYSKGAISIEVPNGKRTVVGLKSMLTSSEFINCKPNTLTFALGKNVEGKPNCPDITKMPHLLVAGTTGSGKSICLSSLIISLLYKYGPDELRFILVDPKQSEFISYESLPHLIVNEIISDVDKAIKALNWAIKEMERRYALFKEMTLAGTLVKNINEYNAHLPEGEEKLPKIVIILDEFGDLMLQNKKDIESRIIRLVQKSRACGIHLILATQRPSVDCITGLIKSNLPTRIGFKVNSFDDSRTIFDIGGAEKLLGAGDMYFRSAQNPDLARIQGCFIDSPEVQAVTDFVKKNNETYFDQSVSDFINTVEEPDDGDGGGGDGDGGEGDVKIDDKFIQALKFCVTSNQASVSMLQRRFPIGYVKACKIIDWMENMNYITQSEGSKPRKVLLSLDEFTRIYGDVDD